MKVIALISLLSAISVHAGPRTSANYTILADIADGGGRRTTSAAYSNDGSLGGIAGLSTVTSPAETAKHGYIGQLYEIVGLVLDAAPTTLNESGTRQLSAVQLLDDATTLTLSSSSVTWSVAAGPLTSIDAAGVATAGIVYQNTAATAQGNYSSYTSTLALTVLNVGIDDFQTYAADAIDDAWQVQYFGQPPNANAGPFVDFDRDGQNNAFEYTAGLIPTDANSVFRLRLEKVPGQPGQKNVIFSPRFADRTYTVKAKASLLSVGGWSAINGSAPSDIPLIAPPNATERTITDLNATGTAKFYQVEIAEP